MKKALRDRWCKALRSGDYKQGIAQLKQGPEDKTLYCCLGVLREIHDPEDETYLGSGSSLSEETAEAVGLTIFKQQDLWERNDGRMEFSRKYWTFSRLANWIEKNVPIDEEAA